MEMLSILPPNIGTRTSDYVVETIELIKKIIENGYGYQAHTAVYFDTVKFRQQRLHAKSQLDRMDVVAAPSEEEGTLTVAEYTNNGKKNYSDYILWKKSEQDEPA